MGMSEQWVAARIKQKGDSKCIPWRNLRDLILAHLNVKKRVDVFALSIYGLILECMLKSRRREIHWMRTTLTIMVPQPFLESGKGLILNLLRKLFSAERVSGYAETR
ncbi:hypothetical protein PVK06_024830 [Gossypium arboreum]|uniref:Uncharacterized protein n=1 Tax=Gossypium arboreum TaxID=29729 RepID=A0ABR0PEZ8_GOSAR|nr:hypothetical protein PVK06_024830 [Gossypium arboreum]